MRCGIISLILDCIMLILRICFGSGNRGILTVDINEIYGELVGFGNIEDISRDLRI